MKWLVVVIFMNMTDVYIFTDPTFDTKDECMTSIMNKKEIPGYIEKLYQEYGEAKSIRAINCLNEKTIKKILTQQKSI